MLVVLATIPPQSPDRPLSPGFLPVSVTFPAGREAPAPLSMKMQLKGQQQPRQ